MFPLIVPFGGEKINVAWNVGFYQLKTGAMLQSSVVWHCYRDKTLLVRYLRKLIKKEP